MPYAFLIVTLVGALAVVLAYRPIRREPFTVLSFSMGWIVGELAFQNIVWQMVATALFIAFGALDNWAGWLGLAVAVLDWVGLLGLGIAGRRAAGVAAAALDEVRAGAFPVPTEPTAPTWGRCVARDPRHPAPLGAIETTRNIDYWGDGTARHRLDVYRSASGPAREGAGHGVHPRRGVDDR